MESLLIMCDKGPFGTNSAMEAIRMGAGMIGLGTGVQCKLLLSGDAVLTLVKDQHPESIGIDSAAEAMEMAELTEMPIVMVKEDMIARGITESDMIEYPNLSYIGRAEIPQLLLEYPAVFRI
jgi:sulfur relay (sulfurtransferase) DsrF/TusC family protein